MKKHLLLIIYSALMVAGLCAGGCSGEPDSALGKIYGVVTTSHSGEPMRSTAVELYINDSYTEYGVFHYKYSLLLKTTTFDDGHFEFDDLKANDYKIIVKADGYENLEYQVKVEAGRTAKVDLQMVKLDTYMTVTTKDVELKGGTRVKFYGNYSYSYTNYYPTEYGFIYNTTPELSIAGGTVIKANSDFTAEVPGLTKGSWYVMAYAKNKVGYEFGNVISFEISGYPEVSTLEVTNTTETTATLNGYVVYEGEPKYSDKGFVYSSSFPNPTVDDSDNATTKVSVSGNSKEFSANISNLTKEKKYYVRAYATGSTGTFYGESISFTATEPKPYIVIDNLAIQLTDLSKGANWNDASKLCSESNVGGHSDWRLPTTGELQFLFNNKDKIGGFESRRYWSSTVGSYGHYYADFSWVYLSDYSVVIDYESDSNTYCVRAVRTVK